MHFVFSKVLFPSFFVSQKKELISGIHVPPFIIGDPAYPLLPWLITGFSDNGQLSQEQLYFNYQLSRARMVVEGAFGRLKGRFRCLLKRNDTSLEYLPAKISACCVLHNLCELKSVTFLEEWENNATNMSDGVDFEQLGDQNLGNDIRDALVNYFSNK